MPPRVTGSPWPTGNVIVVAQKIVTKAEGSIVHLADVPQPRARSSDRANYPAAKRLLKCGTFAIQEDFEMARRMRDKAYREDQLERRYTGKVERINRFIDELGAKNEAGHPPYIPPICGGVDALALSISRDPGPKAGGIEGSGFLSIENDDPSAERMGQFLNRAGIGYGEVIPWNAYPWYINSDPSTEQLRAGVEPLRDLICLMPRLRVVLLHGTAADKGWKLFLREHLDLVEQRGIVWLSTYHTSRQALQTPDRVERELREASIRNDFALAARVMRALSWPAGSVQIDEQNR